MQLHLVDSHSFFLMIVVFSVMYRGCRARPIVNITGFMEFRTNGKMIDLETRRCVLQRTGASVPCVSYQYCLTYSDIGDPANYAVSKSRLELLMQTSRGSSYIVLKEKETHYSARRKYESEILGTTRHTLGKAEKLSHL